MWKVMMRVTTLGCLLLLAQGCAEVERAAATSPLVGAEPIEARGEARVDETLTAGRYTYLKLEGAPEGTWHVVRGGRPSTGQTVQWRGYAELRDFRSSSLGRSFPRLVFTSITPQTSSPKVHR